jgi:hypothetical protein
MRQPRHPIEGEATISTFKLLNLSFCGPGEAREIRQRQTSFQPKNANPILH